MTTTTGRTEAVKIAERDMERDGYKFGPCIQCRQIGQEDSFLWEVEFAYDCETGRSETTDPPSIVLKVNVSTKEVKSIDLM